MAEAVLTIRTPEIRIRDPFIYPDPAEGAYYLYAQTANRSPDASPGVEVYRSTDLREWTSPRLALDLSGTAAIKNVWAPEVHSFDGKFYLFVTLTFDERLPQKPPVDREDWPALYRRGVYVYRSDHPAGPFTPLKPGPHTPDAWMCLDGTLFVEDDRPYLVFCHEWVELVDGTVDYVPLRQDLGDTVGRPERLFRGSDLPQSVADEAKITDGCFLYRSPVSGRLFMIWSTFTSEKGYCVVLTHSESGRIRGPWTRQEIIYSQDGGHGMIFKTFEGRLAMVLHQPNTRGRERLHFYHVGDDGETLSVEGEFIR